LKHISKNRTFITHLGLNQLTVKIESGTVFIIPRYSVRLFGTRMLIFTEVRKVYLGKEIVRILGGWQWLRN